MEVIIYSTPNCHHCKDAKAFFNANNIVYTEIDVAADAEKRSEMIELSGQMGVPVILIGSTDVVVGYDENTLKQLLEIS